MKPQITKSSQKVAVIGAVAAGLVAARELRREGHQVVVFERNNRPGGTWVYDPTTESDPLSIDPSRTIVHTSLYESLRTNLPREVMGFRDFPFVAKHDAKHRDPRRFPSHGEFLHYLEDFVSEFGLSELIRLEAEVLHVGFNEEGKWVVKSRRAGQSGVDEVFNAVVVCNGHNTVPRLPHIPGIDVWPGKQIHSHNYRVPDPYRNKVVVLIGSASSAQDISRDITSVAKEVHVATRSNTTNYTIKQLGYDNLWFHPMIKSTHEDGRMVFEDGSSVVADVILHCTGYKYNFPFLETDGIVTVDDNCVGPLYQHIFPPQLAPWLSFIGLPYKMMPCHMYELQTKWVAGILSGRILFPSQEEMISDAKALYFKLEAAGVPKRHTHNISGYQFEYYDWLAAQCQFPSTEEWRKHMYVATGKNKVTRPETYRDEWEDQDWITQAHEDFLHYISVTRRGNINGYEQIVIVQCK